MTTLMKLSGATIAMAIAGFANIPAVQAAEVFSNGSGYTSGHNPFSFNDVFVAEDFSLLTGTTLKSLSFNALTLDNVTVPVTAVNVKFYSDNFGTPGSEVFSGVFGAAGSVTTGTDGYHTFKDYFVNFGSLTLAAGDYWMGLQVDPAQWDLHWTISAIGALGGAARVGDNAGTSGSYSDYGYNHSFKLYDTAYGVAPVPEPETYAMMLAGLGMLAVAARRRKTRPA